MALFKPFKGDSSRLANTPFHEGYVYLTTDDNCFYADVVDENNVQKRLHLCILF